MRQRPTLELLEPRILYSADTPSALAGALVGTPDAEHRLLDADGEFAAQTAPQEIVFIDARTPESAQLVEDIEAQSARQVEVIVLDAERNGLEQISEALAGRESVAALHFIAHGAEGVMQLGNTLVTADSLERNPSLVQAWSDVLTADADILLYGCDIAATAEGRLLADTLGRLTGADVSASDDATGHASLGGDWTLEYATGTIDVPVATSASTQDAWTHLLPSVVLTSYEPPFADMTDNAYELGGGTTYAQTFSYDSPGATYTVNQIDLVLYSDGGAGGADVDIQLRSALGGGGSNLLASGSVSRAGLTTSESWVSVFLDSTVTLTDNATYYIVIGGGGGGGIFVGIANTDGYSGGNAFIGSTAHTDKDIAFRVGFSDAPVLDLNGIPSGHDTSANFTEQTPVRIAMNATIADPDSTDLTSLTATLTARPDGDAVELLSLNLNASDAADNEGLSVSYDQATGALSITGLASVDTYEEILQGILYNNTSDAPTTTDRTITVVVTDDGGTQSTARTSIIRITGLVNDAPVNNVPGAQTTNEDTALVFSAGPGNAISITDDATNPVRVSLSSTNGTLTLAGTAGLTFSAGDGTADATMTFTGTVAAINAALEGMSFMPNAEFSGAALLSINTNDLGNTGTGGALSDSDTVAITVNAVNDAPVIAGAGGTLLYTEGDAATVIDGTLTPSDVDNTTLASATVTISAGLVSAEDVLSFTTAFGITGSYTAATGVLVLSGSATLAQYEQVLESVTYQNTNTFDPSTGGRTITWVVNDGADNSAGVISTITLAAVNDAPVNAVPGAQATNEDTALVFSGGNAISIADDAGANPVQLTLSGANGVITLAGFAGLIFSAGDGTADATMTFTGTVAAINTALNGMSFLPDADYSGAASLSISTNDQGNTGAGGALSDLDVVAVTVNAVNDAPVNTVPGAQATNEDTALVFSGGNAISITDVDAGASPLQVTLTGTNGLITLAGTAGLIFDVGDGTADGTMTFTGTVAAINAALNSLSFTPNVNFNGPASLSINTNDQGNSGAGGALSDLDAVAITVNAVNDAPVLAPAGPSFSTITEDQLASAGDSVAALLGASVSDVDAGALEGIAITGLSSSNGTWEFSTDGGTSWTAVGAVSNMSALLLRDSDRLRFVPDGSNADAGSVSYRAWDRTSGTEGTKVDVSVNGGSSAFSTATDTASITVTAVNDAPVLAPAGPSFSSITEDEPANAGNSVSALLGASVSDVDAGALGGIAVTALNSSNGTWQFSTDGGASWSAVGAVADSNALLLRDSDRLRFVPDGLNADAGSVSYRAWDRTSGTEGTKVDASVNGGTTAFSAASDTASITVTAVNDAPANVMPAAQATNEDMTLVFSSGNGNAILIADVDAGTGAVQVSLTGTNGVITLAGTTGLTFSAGDGTADGTMTFSGTVTAINTALNGLSFTPDANFNGAASLSINANDQGNTGAGGPLSDLDVVAITVNAMNDAPVNTVPGAQATNEDTVLVFSSISITDVDAGASPVQVSLTGTNGLITLAGTAGLTFSMGDGTTDGTMTFTGTVAAINAALNGLSFLPDANFNGAAALSVNTSDQGNTGAGGVLADLDAVTITVNAVNDAPVIAGASGTLAYTEDDLATFIDTDLTLSDVDDVNIESATVTISAGFVSAEDVLDFTAGFGITGTYNSTTGVLTLSGSAMLAEYEQVLESVTYQNTNTGDPNTGARTINWVVNDGTDNSAAVTSTITVAPVNDAPVNTVPAAQIIDEDTALVLSGGNAISITDVDAGGSPLQVTLTGTNGVITLAGTAGLTFSLGDGTADGTMTFTGTAAAINAALNGLSFAPAANFNGAASLAVNTSDQGNTGAGGALSDLDAVAITVSAVNDAPVNTVPPAQTIDEDTVLVLSGSDAISITDLDAGASPVQVSLSGTNGVITLATTAGLIFSLGDGTADSTMTFSGTVAAINAALNGLSFAPTANFNGAAALSVNTSDQANTGAGGVLSDLDAVTITVNAVNDAPVVTGAGGTLPYTEDDSATFIDTDLTLSDVDDVNIESATVTISAGLVSAEDVLDFTAVAGINGSYNAATGVLTLSGSATLAEYEQVLESVTYQNTNTGNPSIVARTITWVVNDGTDNSADVTSTITVAAVNDAPVIVGAGGTLSYTEGDAATLIDATLALSDVDDVNIESATVTISGGLVSAEDVLSFTSGFGITGTYTAATGVLALSGSATLSQYEQVLESVTYQNTNNANPNTGARTITWVVNDSTDNSAGVTSTITLAAVNDAPVNNVPGAQSTNEDTALVLSGGNAISITDDAGTNPVQVTLSGTNGVITLSGTAGLSFSLGDGTADGTMTFSGTVAAINAALDGLSFAPTANFDGAGSLSISTNDQGNTGAGGALSDLDVVAISVNAVNDAPVNTVPGAQTAYEDTVFVLSSGNGNAISVADLDAGTSPLQVVLTGTNGAITLAGIAGLTFSVGDGVADGTMTFTGTAAAINAALNGLSFLPNANFSGAASLAVDTNDQGNTGAGGTLSDSDVVAVNVLANVAPTVSASGGTTVFTEGSNVASTPVVVDGALTVSDPDSATLATATMSIGAGWQAAEDSLAFASNPATMGNITGSYNDATGVLNLSSAGATATLGQWQAALRSVTYTNTSDTPNTAARTVSFVVSGQGGTSAVSTQQVAVTAVNDAPTVSASGGTTGFTGGASPVVVDAAIGLNDLDNATLAGATVWISGGFQAGQDVIGFSNNPATMGNIAGSYNAASGMLTLSSAGASATLSQWQAALRSVTYGNTSATPIVGARAVSFDVSDGTAGAMAAATHLVDVSPNPAPPDPGPIVPPPPPVIPPVVVGPPPVTPPPTTTPPPSTQTTAPTGGPAGPAVSEASAEAPIQPVTVDIAERPHNPMAEVVSANQSNVGTAPAWRLAVFGTSVQGVELAGGDLLGEMTRQSDSRGATGLSQSGERSRSPGEVELSGDLESLRENLREQDEIQTRGTVALAAGSLSMTLAYLLWLVRGGALVASALSALPAWRILDPLPVLSRVSDDDEDEGDEDDDQAIASFTDEPFGARQ